MVNNVLAGIRDVLLIIVMLAAIVLGALFLGALSDAASRWEQPAPVATLPADPCGGGVC